MIPDGTRPAEIYARPVKPQGRADRPRVAIVIGGLGIGANSTWRRSPGCPAAVTFAFSPYGTDLERWSRARGAKATNDAADRMEPFDYPDNDPGPQTLLTTLSAEQNTDRLHWFLSRFQGYVGVTNLMGARFTATDAGARPHAARSRQARSDLFDGPRRAASPARSPARNSVPFAKADVVLDAVPTAAEIDNALARLEAMARERGIAVGAAQRAPGHDRPHVALGQGRGGRGIVLVPITAVASKPKSS